jgi:hypothetical protein
MVFGSAFTPVNPFGVSALAESLGGNKEKALQIEIEAYAYQKGLRKEGVGGFGRYLLESPFVQMGSTAALMVPVGGGLTATGAYIGARWGATAALTYKTLMYGTTGLFAYMAVADVKKTADEGETGKAIGKGLSYLGIFASGFYGAKVGSQLKLPSGATIGEWAATKGYIHGLQTDIAKGEIPPDVGQARIEATQLRYELLKEIRTVDINQVEPRFGDVQTLKQKPMLKSYLESKFLGKTDSEIFGSTVRPSKPGDLPHDIDVMVKPKTAAQLSKASDFLKTGDISSSADVKPLTKVGEVVGRFYEPKMPSYTTEGGYKTMKYAEAFARLSGAAIEPPSRRVQLGTGGKLVAKDIQPTIDLANEFKPYLSAEGQAKAARFIKAMEFLGKEVIPMDAADEYLLFGSNLKDLGFKIKTRIYEGLISKSMTEADVMKNIGLIVKTPEISVSSISPSVPSISSLYVFSPSPYPFTVFAMPSGSVWTKKTVSYPSSSSSFSIISLFQSISDSVSESIDFYDSSFLSSKSSYPSSSSYPPSSPSPLYPSYPSYPSSPSPSYPSYPSYPSSPSPSYPSSPSLSYPSSYIYPPFPYLPFSFSKIFKGSEQNSFSSIFNIYRERKFKVSDPFEALKELRF